MKEIIFIPIKTKKKLNPFIFKILLFLKLIHFCLLGICNNRDNPFLLNNECVQSCEEEEINNNLCIIENEIIKTQYLNNIIYIKEENIAFLNIEVSENNNLYYILSTYPPSNARIFYMLNNEGYGFLNRDNPYYKTEINDPLTLGRYESIFFPFQLLSESDNKEFLINIGKSN